ncbi:hypothetical protein BIFDEN_00961 [Bifidobacterium dentium ATCC 27678]|nr:hypothetical protein [Bifidobacterium dentium]EDT45140.1 hypothetical protein BIFDEN_00961 [Bifidobacterium dentium ATCC 27678]
MVFPLDGFDSGPVGVKAVVLYVLQSRTMRGREYCSCRWADRNIPDANLTVGMHERTMGNSNMNNNSNSIDDDTEIIVRKECRFGVVGTLTPPIP